MTIYEAKAAAVRNFYGTVSRQDWLKVRCHVWYDQETGVVTPEEPETGAAAAVSWHTQEVAVFGKAGDEQ
jgi:hypothetical protein